MPPSKGRKRKSGASNSSSTMQQFPAPPAHVPIKTGTTPSRTPNMSPIKKSRRPMITASQKQALIDNLQLEITERARKLRAQYALQAQSLRTRLEIRVHRIPAALRKTSIAELIQRYEDARTSPKKYSPVKPRALPALVTAGVSSSPPKRGTKRPSSAIESASEVDSSIANPKKRTRQWVESTPQPQLNPSSRVGKIPSPMKKPGPPPATGRVPPAPKTKAAPKKALPTIQTTASQILSPRSENARPVAQRSPAKPTIASARGRPPNAALASVVRATAAATKTKAAKALTAAKPAKNSSEKAKEKVTATAANNARTTRVLRKRT